MVGTEGQNPSLIAEVKGPDPAGIENTPHFRTLGDQELRKYRKARMGKAGVATTSTLSCTSPLRALVLHKTTSFVLY